MVQPALPDPAVETLPSADPATPYSGDWRRRLGLAIGPAGFVALLLLPAPEGMSIAAWRVAAVAFLMAIWWMTEAIPVAATALLPVVLFPPLGAAALGAATAPFANPLIFLFLGGFVIALAMERWELHRRIALAVIARVGTRPGSLLGGFMLATAGLSMWVSNTATTVMMLPIGLSVIALVQRSGPSRDGAAEGTRDPFATSLLLGIAYAASIGGIATLIGTPPNALLAAFMLESYGVRIGFAQWMLVGLPLSAALLAVAWLLFTRVLFRSGSADLPGAAMAVSEARAALGSISPPERRVACVFAATALGWVIQPLVSSALPWLQLSDTAVALLGALALFLVPAGTGGSERLMDWATAQRLPWEVLILFGGGLSLAAAVNDTGLAAWIGQALEGLSALPTLLLVAGIATVVVFLTEMTSNTATAATFLPLVGALAVTAELAPLMLAAPAALAASCAFMLPVATPPNAIVYGSGMVSIPQMVRAGLWLNVAAIAAITAAAYGLLGWAFAAA